MSEIMPGNLGNELRGGPLRLDAQLYVDLSLENHKFIDDADRIFSENHYRADFEKSDLLRQMIMIAEANGRDRLGVVKSFAQNDVSRVLEFIKAEIERLGNEANSRKKEVSEGYLTYARDEIINMNLPLSYLNYCNKTKNMLLRERIDERTGLTNAENGKEQVYSAQSRKAIREENSR